CRRERDGGKWNKGEEKRLLLLRTAIAEGVEYIDLEEDIAAQIPRFGSTRRIVSYHDFHKTPDDLEALHRHLASLDADIVKISTMANHPHDNVRMLQLIRQSKIPTIGICMGEIGVPTRILAGKYGAPFTYATFHHERALAPGQLTFQQMKEIYRYDELNEQTEVYGVVADPVGHSLSPLIHNAAFKHLKLNKVYAPFRVPREYLNHFLEDCQPLDIKGLSVTIPHKEAIVPKLTQADGAVRGIGACNTVIFEGAERIGYNTDYRAAMESLEEAMGIPPNTESPLRGKTALILGSGGVGKAIAYGLLRRGAAVVVTDGIAEKARQLAEQFQCRYAEWAVRHTV
ncbi:MAG TPA: type I 3-dehydroquinate dehydratase, partial [Thermoguttaceae bacterium]|nr:type I 3-dehydroquinate dehydratase [Thermoguttaceae bacterium]